MHDREVRNYKGYKIIIEFYGKSPMSKNTRNYFVEDKDGNRVRHFRSTVFKTLWEAKAVIDLKNNKEVA